MEVLGLSREEACWWTPMVTLYRMQMAWLENHGDEQRWGPDPLEQLITEADGKWPVRQNSEAK